MRYAVSLLLTMLLTGCVYAKAKVDGKWYREQPHPTQEQILEAAKVGPPIIVKPMPLNVTTNPKLPMPRYPLRITCNLPRGIEGDYVFEVVGLFKDSGPITRRELSKIVTMPCYSLDVVCQYSEYRTPTGYQDPKRIALTLEPATECQNALQNK